MWRDICRACAGGAVQRVRLGSVLHTIAMSGYVREVLVVPAYKKS